MHCEEHPSDSSLLAGKLLEAWSLGDMRFLEVELRQTRFLCLSSRRDVPVIEAERRDLLESIVLEMCAFVGDLQHRKNAEAIEVSLSLLRHLKNTSQIN